MNDKQKWLIVVAVGCVSALIMAISFSDFDDVFDIVLGRKSGSVATNWTGCVLFGMLCSSITGLFLFKYE